MEEGWLRVRVGAGELGHLNLAEGRWRGWDPGSSEILGDSRRFVRSRLVQAPSTCYRLLYDPALPSNGKTRFKAARLQGPHGGGFTSRENGVPENGVVASPGRVQVAFMPGGVGEKSKGVVSPKPK